MSGAIADRPIAASGLRGGIGWELVVYDRQLTDGRRDLLPLGLAGMILLMQSPTEVLERIDPLRGVVGYGRVADFLRHPTTQYHNGGGSNRVSVRQTDHAWGTRLAIARKKGLSPAAGSEDLIAAISEMPADTMLEASIFESELEIAAFWFIETTGAPVGFVIVPRNIVDGVPVPL